MKVSGHILIISKDMLMSKIFFLLYVDYEMYTLELEGIHESNDVYIQTR